MEDLFFLAVQQAQSLPQAPNPETFQEWIQNWTNLIVGIISAIGAAVIAICTMVRKVREQIKTTMKKVFKGKEKS